MDGCFANKTVVTDKKYEIINILELPANSLQYAIKNFNLT